MSVVIGSIEFEGPFADLNDLEETAGIYALLCENKGELELLELEDTCSIRDSFVGDEFTSNLRFFQENATGTLLAAVHYTPELSGEERRQVMTELRKEFEC